MEELVNLGTEASSRTPTLFLIEIPQLTYRVTPSEEKGLIIPANSNTTASIDYPLASMEGQENPTVLETAEHPTPPALVSNQTSQPPSRETPSQDMAPAISASCQPTATERQEFQRRAESQVPVQGPQLSSREVSPMEMSPDIHVNCQPAVLDKKESPRAAGIMLLFKPAVSLLSSKTSSSSRESCAMEKRPAIPPTNCHPTAKKGKARPKSSLFISVSKPAYFSGHPQRSLSVGACCLEKRPSVPIANYPNSPSRRRKSQQSQGRKFKSKRVDPLKGQKVIARSEENGFYFPGTVVKCISPTRALVQFKYGDAQIVPMVFIIPMGGAMPVLQVGDYVFAKIMIRKGYDFYVPAVIIETPKEEEPYDQLYTVLKCNNRRDFCLRSGLIKISQNKYAVSCSFISSTPMKTPPKPNEKKDSDFLLFHFEEAETDPLKDTTDDDSKRNKNKKKSDIKKQFQEVSSSDSEDSPYEAEPYMSCSKARSRVRGFLDSVSKENSNKYTKSYAPRIKTFPKCQCQCKTLHAKKFV